VTSTHGWSIRSSMSGGTEDMAAESTAAALMAAKEPSLTPPMGGR
jgi:hypothetical protein